MTVPAFVEPPAIMDIPIHRWFMKSYQIDVLSRLDYELAELTSITGEILKIDSTKKITNKLAGPSCSKLTTSLVNVSLKFQTLILQIDCYFLLKKCENHLFSTKNNSVFVTLAEICFPNLCFNDIVKLTML